MTTKELREAAEEWLNTIIQAYQTLTVSFNPTETRNYEECCRCIEAHASDRRIHCKNIADIADALGVGVKIEEYDTDAEGQWYIHSIQYEGYEFFELFVEKEEEK